jgi:enamine deaminase RidA (YjgF/YER057c/UK114 family)
LGDSSGAERSVCSLRKRVTSGSPFEAKVGFSRAVRVGDRVTVSGTAPIWPDGSCPEDAGVQAERCLAIIDEALGALGAGLEHVVRTRIYLVDAADWEAVAAVHGSVFGDVRPASTMLVVAALLDPRWRLEIEAEAVVPS